MTYRGHVEGGVIVLDSAKKAIPEGTIVKIEPLLRATAKRRARGLKALLRFAGSVKGLPKDMARNHDHYLHGLPKK